MIDENKYSHIVRASSPDALKTMKTEEIAPLCDEIRRFLVEKVTKQGGHLASNLGVVELTVALHRVFSSPKDRLIFDVGHQSYVHKILTGRADRFDTLRTPGGLSGFQTRREGEHDPFGAGHSSTSLSAALGFAEADLLNGEKRYTVAVVGDGAFTGGMLHEALNNCKRNARLIIVLNDNEMSISRNIGLFAKHLSRIRVSGSYGATKRKTKSFLYRIPLIGRPVAGAISYIKSRIRRCIYSHNYFEDLGITYLGPVDGHNEKAVERALRAAKARDRAAVVHVMTVKGKGYQRAEDDPTAFHGVTPTGAVKKEDGLGYPSFHHAASDLLCRLAEKDSDVCAVTAAMGEGTGLVAFSNTYPDRFFDVGIAEAHALTFSAGLAAAGKKPYFAVYSTFLQRAYDSLLHDVALQKLPVRILVDRAGLSNGDGATHHGIFDVAFASHIPHVKLYAPASYRTLEKMLEDSLEEKYPLIIRYPNAAEDGRVSAAFYPRGDYEGYGVRAYGEPNAQLTIVTYGKTVTVALDAKERLEKEGTAVRILLLEVLAPYEATAEKILSCLSPDCHILFIEEGIKAGGAGVCLFDVLRKKIRCDMEILAIDGHFASPETAVPLDVYCGMDTENVIKKAKEMLKNNH